MDKNAIRKYAIWAKKELLEKVNQRASIYGITKEEISEENTEHVNGILLTPVEKKQRQALINRVKRDGYDTVMKEVAYTWFNRFVAIRYMEVNGYLPDRVRIFTDENGTFAPQILKEAIHLDLDGLDLEKVYALKEVNDEEALYRYLLVTQCNAFNTFLPYMFEKIEDATELLLPDYLLRQGSVLSQMVCQIPEEDWKDQVQIIGWLYQYYNAEPKDLLINAHKQYEKKDIPFVTQLFTPDWIVRYMVENSLGRLWLEAHPESELRSRWSYYIKSRGSVSGQTDTLGLLQSVRKELSPEEIKFIDPCMGSGHILVYAFEVFMQIYESAGYTQRDAAELILEKNLYGLDLDDRAGQLAYFAIMMMARKYHRTILKKNIQPNVMSIQNSSEMTESSMLYIADGDEKLYRELITLKTQMRHAKEYGSLLNLIEIDYKAIDQGIERCLEREENLIAEFEKNNVIENVLPMIKQGKILSGKYEICVTNPPYMNRSMMPDILKTFLQTQYCAFKTDLFAAFTKKICEMVRPGGQIGLLMPYVWMFLSSYEKMREYIYQNTQIRTLIQLEYNAFEAACIPVAALTLHKSQSSESGEYIRLSEFRGAENQGPMTLWAIENPDCGYRYSVSQEKFTKIPGMPVAYWTSDAMADSFRKASRIEDLGASRSGMQTGNNALFLRLWFEVEKNNIRFDLRDLEETKDMKEKWIPQPKGGPVRKWYGNLDYVVNFAQNGRDLRNYEGNSIIKNPQFYFREGISWSHTTSSIFSARYLPKGCIFNVEAPAFYPREGISLNYVLGFMNTKILQELFGYISQTMHYMAGDMAKIPIYMDVSKDQKCMIEALVEENVSMAKEDWDSFETSWDFKMHPLIRKTNRMEEAFEEWKRETQERFYKVKENEETLNAIFGEIYGIEKNHQKNIKEEEITIRKADLSREIKSFLSYAVGCMFGRYSLDVEGLAYAGGAWDHSQYRTFLPDTDNIIPICDDEYFQDDIVTRFVAFVSLVYGEEYLEENLSYIAEAIGGKGSPREVIRNYFLKKFYQDHCNTYAVTGSGKRPIYWLFDSGRKNGFKCLIYMHRYQADLIARIRTDYVHELQTRYHTVIEEIEERQHVLRNDLSQSEIIKLSKKLKSIKEQEEELSVYEEKIHHYADQMLPMDLDDGVKANYARFQEILAKIR